MHSLLTTNRIIELTLSTGIPLERSFQTRSQEPYNGHRTPPAFLIVYPSTPGLPIYGQQPLLHCYTQQSHTILCSLQPALPALVQNNDAAEKGATLHLLLFPEKNFSPNLSAISPGVISTVMHLTMLYGHLISKQPLQHVSTLVQVTLPSDDAPR